MKEFKGTISMQMGNDESTRMSILFEGTLAQLSTYIEGFDPRVRVVEVHMKNF